MKATGTYSDGWVLVCY